MDCGRVASSFGISKKSFHTNKQRLSCGVQNARQRQRNTQHAPVMQRCIVVRQSQEAVSRGISRLIRVRLEPAPTFAPTHPTDPPTYLPTYPPTHQPAYTRRRTGGYARVWCRYGSPQSHGHGHAMGLASDSKIVKSKVLPRVVHMVHMVHCTLYTHRTHGEL